MTNLNEISKQVYEANKLKGFDVKNENIGQTLCLIHSEISEALEAIRKDNSATTHMLTMPKQDLKKLQFVRYLKMLKLQFQQIQLLFLVLLKLRLFCNFLQYF